MPSPFPSMDPFIESRRIWSDFHLDLAAEIRAHLNAQIQPVYYATAVTYVTYDVPVPAPPFESEQQAWVDNLLAAYWQ